MARQIGCGQADILLVILVHHVVAADRARAAGPPKADFVAAHALQLQGHMFPNMGDPGAFIFFQAANKATGHAIGTTVVIEAR